jgi:hypothetical protein
MNIVQTPSGLQKVIFTRADVQSLLITAAETALSLGSTAGLRAYFHSPAELPETAAFVVAGSSTPWSCSVPDGGL